MKLSAHFDLSELTHSATAAARGIDNTPPPDVLANLEYRLVPILEEVRSVLGSHPLIITSGFRCHALNEAVGGAGSVAARRYDPNSKPSAHLFGLAADFVCPQAGSPFTIAQRLAGTPGLDFDQIINEQDSQGNMWVHIGVSADGQAARHMSFNAYQRTTAS